VRSFAVFAALTTVVGALAIAAGCGRFLGPIDLEPEANAPTSTDDSSADARGAGDGLDAADANADDERDAAEEGDATYADAASDAHDGAEASVPCAPQCSSCSSTGTCIIQCPGPKCTLSTLSCPDGQPCHVECNGTNSCTSKTINCALNQPCTLACSYENACASVIVKNSSNLCLQCTQTNACSSLTCMGTPQTCKKRCVPDGTNGGACAAIACGNCTSVSSDCP
jgi:hypothetical protein